MSEKKEKQQRKTRAEFIAEHKRMVEDLQKYEAQLNRMVQIVGTIVSHGQTSNLPYALSLSKVEKFNGALDLNVVREQDLLTIQVSYNANV